MKVLVCIAYYGHENERYVRELIAEYRAMDIDVDIVVVTESEKELEGVVQRVGLPTSDPYSLPFAHKWVFAEHVDDYDLFIYSEDDTLVRRANIDAFMWASSVLPPGTIAGFLRTEETATGELRCSSAHSHFHWDPGSPFQSGGHVFGEFTNPHGACYMLTRAQLRGCLDSGRFLTGSREGLYDTRVTAATDPYTVCGFRKVVCVSRLDEFLLPHLTNKYTSSLGAPLSQLKIEADQLAAIAEGRASGARLVHPTAKLETPRWDKRYHEPARAAVLDAVPADAARVLSVGAGAGWLEAALRHRGHAVTAIPLDSVTGAVVASRGIDVTAADFATAFAELEGREFDAIVVDDVLNRVADPVAVLRCLIGLAGGDARIAITLPNVSRERTRRLLGRDRTPIPSSLAEHGVEPARSADVRRWLVAAGFECAGTTYTGSDRAFPRVVAAWTEPLAVLAGRRPEPRSPRTPQPGLEGGAPRVSVGLPVYNGEDYLRESLDALRGQTFRDLEIIVSDNASTDGTEAICRQAAAEDPRVRYFRHDVNRGAAFNYNFAFRQARGELFCWTSHDDTRHPRNIQRCVEAFDAGSGSLVAVAASAVFVDEQGRVLEADTDDNAARGAVPARRLRSVLDHVNQANSIWALVRTSALERTNLIAPFIASDYVLLAELAMHGEIEILDEQLFRRRVHPGMSRKANTTPLDVARWFDATAKRPVLSAKQRLAVEYWRAVDRVHLPQRDSVAARLTIPTRMLIRMGRVRGGRAKQRLRAGASQVRAATVR